MISKSKLPAVCVLLSCFVTCQRRDYIGADNAGLDTLLLQRRGADGEEGRKGTGIDFKTIKSLHVVKDLYGVLEWVEKRNKMHKEYLGLSCVPTGRSLIGRLGLPSTYNVDISPSSPAHKSKGFWFISSRYDRLWVFPRNVFDTLAHL